MRSERDRVIVHGIPGEGARAKGVMKGLTPLLISILLFGLFAGIILPIQATGVVLGGFVIAFLVMLWMAYNSYSGVESYFKGARGEEIVAIWLASLPETYHVFHDVEIGGDTSIDHLVAGPAGIFVIETKFWSGRVISDGQSLLVDGIPPSRSPSVQVMAAVNALKGLLARKMGDVPVVTPVVCFAGNTLEATQGRSFFSLGDVAVCNVTELCDLITRRGEVLPAVDIERFIKVLEF